MAEEILPLQKRFSHTVKERLALYYNSLIDRQQTGINWIPRNSENRMQRNQIIEDAAMFSIGVDTH